MEQCYKNPGILSTNWQASTSEINGFVCIDHCKAAISFIPPKEKRIKIWNCMMLSSMPVKTAGSAPAYCPKTSWMLHVKHESWTSRFLAVLHPHDGIWLYLFCGQKLKDKENIWLSCLYLCAQSERRPGLLQRLFCKVNILGFFIERAHHQLTSLLCSRDT